MSQTCSSSDTDLVYKFDSIRSLHVELTNKCNALCPMCARSIQGAFENPNMTLGDLSTEEFAKVIPQDFIKQLSSIYFNGNFGDPGIAANLIDIIDYIQKVNPLLSVRIHTNGGMRNAEWWVELAKRFRDKHCWVHFGIDGLEDTNHLYRVNVNWTKLMANVKSFIGAGGNACWDLIVFKHNEHQVDQIKALSKELGFKNIVIKKTARFVVSLPEKNKMVEALPVYNKDRTLSHLIEPPANEDNKNKIIKSTEEKEEYFNLKEDLPQRLDIDLTPNVDKNRDFSKKYANTNFEEWDEARVDCRVKSELNLFLDCHGYILPCCWTTWPLFSFWSEPEAVQLREMIDNLGGFDVIDAKKHHPRDIVEGPFFRQIASGWKKKKIQDGKPLICVKTCRAENNALSEEGPQLNF